MGIKKLILDGEGVTLDFKQTITNCNKIAKTMTSFANNKGGKLLIGVANDGKILGVKAEEEEKYMILKAANMYCKPSLVPIFEEIYIDDKIILQVEIKKSMLKPHYALVDGQQWAVYIRIKDKSVLADELVVEVIKRENNKEASGTEYLTTEKDVLTYLQANKSFTTKEYSTMFNLSYYKTQCILINLVLSGIIKLHSTENETYFTAS